LIFGTLFAGGRNNGHRLSHFVAAETDEFEEAEEMSDHKGRSTGSHPYNFEY